MKENKTNSMDELRDSLVRLSDIGSPDDTQEIGDLIGRLHVAFEDSTGITLNEAKKVRQVLHALEETGFLDEEVAEKYFTRLDKQARVEQARIAIEELKNTTENYRDRGTQQTALSELERSLRVETKEIGDKTNIPIPESSGNISAEETTINTSSRNFVFDSQTSSQDSKPPEKRGSLTPLLMKIPKSIRGPVGGIIVFSSLGLPAAALEVGVSYASIGLLGSEIGSLIAFFTGIPAITWVGCMLYYSIRYALDPDE